MRILLTGSNGFLGRHILISTAASGVHLVCATRGDKGDCDKTVSLGPGPWGQAEFEHALAVSQADVVLHCVGATHNGDFRQLFEANTFTAAGLLAAASTMTSPPRIILIGSAAEYGFVPANAMPVSEDYLCQPRSQYGISKYAQTLLGLAASEHGLPVLTARLFNPVGVGMPRNLALPSFARRITMASNEDSVIRVGDIEVSRDFIDVTEVARILLSLARIPRWPWPIINLCSGRAYRLGSLLESMIAASGRSFGIEVDPVLLRPGDMPVLTGSVERLSALGLRPATPDFERLIPELLAEWEPHGRLDQ
ncbi:NAD-dependent epimerase/dehydratase family protein [Microvirga calopogonii]|uniref:NAD-dependent epimerase/dehydratase family protein n=1 Tax=Microvirga calopogonii TaxID=2078013 RepID=UPI000E0DAE9B